VRGLRNIQAVACARIRGYGRIVPLPGWWQTAGSRLNQPRPPRLKRSLAHIRSAGACLEDDTRALVVFLRVRPRNPYQAGFASCTRWREGRGKRAGLGLVENRAPVREAIPTNPPGSGMWNCRTGEKW